MVDVEGNGNPRRPITVFVPSPSGHHASRVGQRLTPEEALDVADQLEWAAEQEMDDGGDDEP